jgi:hypothetical protein
MHLAELLVLEVGVKDALQTDPVIEFALGTAKLHVQPTDVE